MHPRLAAAAFVFCCFGVTAADPIDPASPPLETDLVERTGSRLVQLEVTVSGPPEVIADLEPDDFKLKIKKPVFGPIPLPGMTQRIRDFQLDPVCPLPPVEVAAASKPRRRPAQASRAQPSLPRPVSYLLYFDQPHLTLVGRQRSIDLARELVPQLVTGGSRAMIVSNARRLAVIEELTGDVDRLLRALDRLEGDHLQWDHFAEGEENRVAQVAGRLSEGLMLGSVVGMARNFQFEEVYQANRSLRRLRLTLSRFAEIDSWKAALYFADTMRQDAGAHYTSFFGSAVLTLTDAQILAVDGIMAQPAFDRLVNEAVAQGIRFYPVQGRGLVNRFEFAPARFFGSSTPTNRVRQTQAEETLFNLAAETGGQAFVRGEAPARIALQIRQDYGCLLLISFRSEQLPEDSPLAVILEPLRTDVEIRSRGRVVVQSERSRTATRLLSSFLFERGEQSGGGLGVQLVPTGYEQGAYSALLQITVPGTSLATSSWDVGASLVHKDKVREEVSGRLEVRRPGVSLVFESEVRVRPGEHKIVAVAHETGSNLVLSHHLPVSWPDPDARSVTLVGFALLQPEAAAFSREGVLRARGSLARSRLEPVDAGRPAALMGLVCRNRSHKGSWTVERTVVGGARVDFPPLEVELEQERCVQVRDLIPADSLGPGAYRYEVRLTREGDAYQEAARHFQAYASDVGL